MTLNEILYAVRVRLNKFDANSIGEVPLIDMANLACDDLIAELPDNALIHNTKKQGISSASGYEEYSLPSDYHKLLNLMQNDEGGPDPIVATLEDPAAAGNIDNGVHSYKITATIAAVESLASVSSNEITITDKNTNGKVDLVLPLGPTGTTKRTIYRTEAGGAAYKKLADVNDNTTTTYLDNIADGSLSTALPAQTKTNTPRISQLIAANEQYLIKNEPSAYQTSALERPRHWLDNAKYWVYPIPIVTRIGYFQWSYIAKPTRMTALASVCSFHDEYRELVVWKTTMKALTAQSLPVGDCPAQYSATLQALGINVAGVHKIGGVPRV